jgi:hypothetical protein
MTEPVVVHHGRKGEVSGHNNVRPTAATACWAASSGGAFQIANGDQVAVSDCSNVCVVQADERLDFAGCEDELDLKTVRRMQADDGAEITSTQAVLGKVPIQNDGVEQVEHG